MDWQNVRDDGREEAAAYRSLAAGARTAARDCTDEARSAVDADEGAVWLMRAVLQRSAAASDDALAEINDRIADHAQQVLSALP